MKYGIELNGVANIKMLLTLVKEDFGHEYCIEDGQQAIEDIDQQLDLLERYMIAFCEAVNNNTEPPKWHEVRENPKQYKTNRERF